MTPQQKQQYLAERNLLLPNPRAAWGPGGQNVQLQRHTIQLHLTEQQKQLLTSMDPEQRSIYLQKLQKDQIQQQQQRQLLQRQQMLQQQQQQGMTPGQQQQQGGMVSQAGPGMVQQQAPAPSGPRPGLVSQAGGGMMPGQQPGQQWGSPAAAGAQYQPGSGHSPSPGSPLHQLGSLSPGQVGLLLILLLLLLFFVLLILLLLLLAPPIPCSPNSCSSSSRYLPADFPVQAPLLGPGVETLIQHWLRSPELLLLLKPLLILLPITFNLLFQVPRTPQQIQHLQRLQMQRQQVEYSFPATVSPLALPPTHSPTSGGGGWRCSW